MNQDPGDEPRPVDLRTPGDSPGRPVSRILNAPETGVLLFSFLLNLPWEFLQVPFYRGMASAGHWEAVQLCTRASIGDAGIALVAFWTVSLTVRTRGWVRRPRVREVLGFVVVGVVTTVGFERLATGMLDRWTYAERMPVVPALEIGLLPLLQWILLPPLVLWLAGRYLRGA